MSDHHEHHRDAEPETNYHRRSDDLIPASAKWISNFIKETGFPIAISCFLLWVLFFRMTHLEHAFVENSQLVADAVHKNTEAVTALRHFLTHKYDD